MTKPRRFTPARSAARPPPRHKPLNTTTLLLALFFIMPSTLFPASVPAVSVALPAAPWVPDRGDGAYRNPVLHADYSDPDAIRVGADYWMTASSFSHSPGLPILHSRDLINWTLVNHALPRLVPEAHFATPRHGEGVWAPALRFHAGRFWIFYPDPDFGVYVITAADPRGRWSAPFLLKAGRGIIDPCPLWDDDGRAWLVHGWAKSRAGINNLLTLHEMSPDGTRLLDEGAVVIDANQMPGWKTLEGPKLYKREGWYYVFAPAGGVAEGYQAVFRSRDIRGPYENRIVLEQGATPVNGPHQGAWVDTPEGEHWFFHFQEIEAHGRVVHLQPMRWHEDGWPVMGDDTDGDGTGQPVLTHLKPALPTQPASTPATSDHFTDGRPDLQWQWQGNPGADWIVPPSGEVRDRLRLRTVSLPQAKSLWLAPNLLMQKFPAPEFSAEVILTLHAAIAGERAGLIVFGYDYGWAGLRLTETGEVELLHARCQRADKGGAEQTTTTARWAPDRAVRLRVTVAADRTCRFSYREAEDETGVFVPLGTPFLASSSRWVGAKVGVFAAGPAGGATTGHADFEFFKVAR